MYLLQPLRVSFELNYVAPHAQSSVPIPEGLNLNSWIVSPPKVVSEAAQAPKKPKKPKGKGKEREKDKQGTKKKTQKPEPEYQETPEEKAAREKVLSNSHPFERLLLITNDRREQSD